MVCLVRSGQVGRGMARRGIIFLVTDRHGEDRHGAVSYSKVGRGAVRRGIIFKG